MSPFGVKVLWMAKCVYSAEQVVAAHYHNFVHALYVLEPSGRLEIDRKDYPATENSLFFIPPGVVHGIFASEERNLKTIELKFVISDKRMLDVFLALPRSMADRNLAVRIFLEKLIGEGIEEREHYHELINLKTAELLFTLSRNQRLSPEIPPAHTSEDLQPACQPEARVNFLRVISYMKKNLHHHLELEELASLVNLNPSYFCSLFQHEFGIPPIHYLMQLRLEQARHLLLSTRLTVSEIAFRVGFQSIHNFSRYFRKCERLSPLQYRERFQDVNYIFLETEGSPFYGSSSC